LGERYGFFIIGKLVFYEIFIALLGESKLII
jgi:hypothetical protein